MTFRRILNLMDNSICEYYLKSWGEYLYICPEISENALAFQNRKIDVITEHNGVVCYVLED